MPPVGVRKLYRFDRPSSWFCDPASITGTT